MRFVKNKKEIVIMREAGHRLARIIERLKEGVNHGTSLAHVDELAGRFIREGGDTPALFEYQPHGSVRPFPANICISINNEVVHGIPNEKEKTVQSGDIVKLDLSLRHKGMHADMAITFAVGNIDLRAKRLIAVTEEALFVGIAAARHGGHMGDIGHAIFKHATNFGLGVVVELGGHGIGRSLHELPYVPNTGIIGGGAELKKGMTLAIEPMTTEGSPRVFLDKDGYTWKTKDGGRSAHFEHTILITDNDPEILTCA